MYSGGMEWLNYHHLLYFWMVARRGSIARACEDLRLAQPTVSAQIRALEESFGEKLLVRAGRRLVMTESGRLVYQYADEIFTLGRELTDVLKGRPHGRPARLVVGISDLIPKLIAYRILKPALALKGGVQLVCYEDTPERLLLGLSAHELDLVLTDAPADTSVRVRVFSHLLGSCGIALYAAARTAPRYRKNFPRSIDGAPLLLPTQTSAFRRILEQWFETHSVRPRIVAEFQDTALLNVFAQAEVGIFAAPTAVQAELRKHYRVAPIGELETAAAEYYAISAERKIKHPAVAVISDAARSKLFAGAAPRKPAPQPAES